MIFELIIITVVIILMTTVPIMYYKKRQKEQKNAILELFKAVGTVTQVHNKTIFKTMKNTFEIVFFKVPANAELTFNSKTVWEIKTAYQTKLFNDILLSNPKLPKIIIVYPSTQRIKRYINENELEFITYHHMFDDKYVVKKDEIDLFLKTLLEN